MDYVNELICSLPARSAPLVMTDRNGKIERGEGEQAG